MLCDAGILDLLHGFVPLRGLHGHIVIAHLPQPVHTDEGLEGVGGVIVGAQGRYQEGFAIQLGEGQLVVFHHAIVVGGGNRREIIHVEGGQIAVSGPLRNLGIVVFHQHGGQIIRRRQHGVLGHNVGPGNGDEIHGDVVLVAEVFLDPLGPVVVLHVGYARLTTVIDRDRDGHVLREGFPGRRGFRGSQGQHGQHHDGCQHQGKDLFHRGSPPFLFSEHSSE